MMHKGVFFALIISTCYLITTTSSCGFFKTPWTVYITNEVPDDIVVHIKSTDYDLGNHTIAYNQVYILNFCQKLVGTHFHGYFWWGSKYTDLALMDSKIIDICRERGHVNQYCYWLVKPYGFFVSASNQTFPNGWEKRQSWP